ncbi:MAG TPA: polysaccharide deacetylase family protein [Streptosporangiaceae bacterium]|nr:polysaccharide deacetylase family protein [Streptosporangiaceae bacterium]
MSAHLADGRTECAADAVPVLMYHSIGIGATRKFERFVVDPGEFAAQMDYLDAAGYHPVTAADLAGSRSGRPLPPRPVVLTFDDAYTDFYSAALPVLRRHGFRSTLYVPTAYVGGTARFNKRDGEENRPVLPWGDLRDIATEGVEMAAHSHTHPQLDRVPTAIIRDEVHRSRRTLEDNLGLGVEGFAYPFGYWNGAARAAVAAAGFRYACAVADLMAGPADDVLTLPRLTVNAGIGVTGLACLLGARPTPHGRRVAAAKRIAWRALRRTVRPVGGDPREGRPAT